MMKKLLRLLLPIIFLLCGWLNYALASPYYFNVQYGLNFVQGYSHPSQAVNPGATVKTDYKTGTIAAIKLGRTISKYLNLDIGVTKRTNRIGSSTVGSAEVPKIGDWTVMSYMLDGNLMLPQLKKLTPYIGGGVGLSTVNPNTMSRSSAFYLNDKQTKFSWQAHAGFLVPLYARVAAYIEYQYLQVNETYFTNTSSVIDRPYKANSVSFGIKLSF